MTDTTSDPSSFLPADDVLLAQIDAQASDIMSVPTGNTVEGDPVFLAKFAAPRTMAALAPEDREIVNQRLQALPLPLRASKEPELVQQFIAEKVRSLRVKQGPGPNANALTQERWMLAREADELDQQQDAIIEELSAVDRYDPETGQAILRHPTDSPKRRVLDAELIRLNTLATNIRNGTEGQDRLAAARQRALVEAKRQLTEQYVATEAKRRAEAQAVEERIAQMVEGRAKRLKNHHV